MLTGRAGLRAMNRACADLVGHDNALDGVEFAGRTDWSILDDIMRMHGMPLDRPLLDELSRRYVAHLADEIQLPGNGMKDVMPGIRPLLDALQSATDVALGLLTGNFMDGARIKLEYFDLWRYFPCGAFGGDSADRNELVPVAIDRARECGLADVDAGATFSWSATRRTTSRAPAPPAPPRLPWRPAVILSNNCARRGGIVFTDLRDTSAFLGLLAWMESPPWQRALAEWNRRPEGLAGPKIANGKRMLVQHSSPKASEGWRKRLGVEPSPPAQRGKQPILKTGRATGPRSLPIARFYPPIPRRYITSFCSSDTTNRTSGRRRHQCAGSETSYRVVRTLTATPLPRSSRLKAKPARLEWYFEVIITMLCQPRACARPRTISAS